ncbi:MAG TPA: methylated-DNA--[protein]-cysteine S-methyltransferase [Methylophilaceae bacterium]|nr:methylated-DNA--[protein]-cysteine S-methyltransferase [Methylophilaceae bacterium]
MRYYPDMDTYFDAIVAAPFGAVGVRVKDDFLVGLQLIPSSRAEQTSSDPFVQHVAQQIKRYLQDPHMTFDIPFAVIGTPFQKRVWRAIAAIPPGKTLTYSELAEKVASGPRAVANVCGANQVPLVVPCHRVVAKTGLGGFMQGQRDGLAVKQWLLDHEARP